ncbi:transmembrane protein 177-like isoform X2 [Glandiceps talaboti]
MASRLFRERNVRILVGVVAGGVFLYNAIPVVFPGQTIGRIYRSYAGGEGGPLSTKCREEFDEVCADLGIKKMNKYHPFPSFGTEIHKAGMSWLPNGAHLGIPDTFTMQKAEEIMKNMKLVRQAVDWESDHGKELAQSLILSKDARKYYIAKELCEMKASHVLMPTVVAPVFIVASYASGQVMKFVVPMLVPGLVSFGVAAIGFVAYSIISGFVYTMVENSADKTVAKLSPEYAKGGVELYEKTLKKHQNLRKILGKNGEKLYSYYGNENRSAMDFRPALTDRLRTVGEIHKQNSKG